MESRFHYNNFWLCEPFGGSLWAEVDRSRIITSFVAQSDLCSR